MSSGRPDLVVVQMVQRHELRFAFVHLVGSFEAFRHLRQRAVLEAFGARAAGLTVFAVTPVRASFVEMLITRPQPRSRA